MSLPKLAFVDASTRQIFTNNDAAGRTVRLAISAPTTNAIDSTNFNVYIGSGPDLNNGNADYTLAPNSGPIFVAVSPSGRLYACSDSGAPVVVSDPAMQGWPRVAALLETAN